MMDVVLTEEADVELSGLPVREWRAMQSAFEKLEQYGDRLPFPHSSKVMGRNLRELRPRAGNSPWRAFYRRIGEIIVIGGIGPEAQVVSLGFQRSAASSESRLDRLETGRAR
ncbi:MAG: hypothetical protein EXR51_06830 [Dehalococcoidia bacterium]|nr:hypothetical protein [Dehalococcoidia bacterium]